MRIIPLTIYIVKLALCKLCANERFTGPFHRICATFKTDNNWGNSLNLNAKASNSQTQPSQDLLDKDWDVIDAELLGPTSPTVVKTTHGNFPTTQKILRKFDLIYRE